MNGTGESRALVVGRSIFGLGSMSPAGNALAVRLWSEDPDGRARGRPAAGIPMAVIEPDRGLDDGPVAGRAIVVFDVAFDTYRFGLHDYDPWESLASSLDQATAGGAPLSLALWAAMEADLFRFAFDRGFTDALDSRRGSADWTRFARLNDLYRACVRAIAPFGIVPPTWNSWLRAGGNQGHSGGGFLAAALTRRVEALARTLRLRPAEGQRTLDVPGLKLAPP